MLYRWASDAATAFEYSSLLLASTCFCRVACVALTTIEGHAGNFHHAVFHRAFANSIERFPNVQVHFSKRSSSVSRIVEGGCTSQFITPLARYLTIILPATSYTIHFADETTAACDLVLGSDGVHSTVRASMFNLAAEDLGDHSLRDLAGARWSGQMVYRFMTPMNEAVDKWRSLGGQGDQLPYEKRCTVRFSSSPSRSTIVLD
jgi:2-polyprenyl-6-methoxyphenol hydroxylase-like FAD-dependent oxidoreductase